MANEVQWQAKIIGIIRKAGGYGKKWATQYAVGVPDLILVLPGLGTMTVEVKLEKSWNKNTSRTIKLTPKQAHELIAMNEAGGRAFVLIVVEIARGHGVARLYLPPKQGTAMTIEKSEFMYSAFDLKNTVGFVPWLKNEILKLEKTP